MLKELRSGYTVTNLGGVEYSIGPNSDFTNADLRGLDLSQTDLHGSIFAGADLSFTELSGSDFSLGVFNNEEFGPAVIDYATMIDTVFEFADMEGVSMFEANLTRANFFYAHLDGACLNSCNLVEACFSYSHMFRTDLRSANYENANFDNAIFVENMLLDFLEAARWEVTSLSYPELEILMLLLGLQEWRKRQIDAQYDVEDDDAFWEVDNDSYDD